MFKTVFKTGCLKQGVINLTTLPKQLENRIPGISLARQASTAIQAKSSGVVIEFEI